METNEKAQPHAPSGGTRRLPKVTQVNGRSRARHSRSPHGPLPAPAPCPRPRRPPEPLSPRSALSLRGQTRLVPPPGPNAPARCPPGPPPASPAAPRPAPSAGQRGRLRGPRRAGAPLPGPCRAEEAVPGPPALTFSHQQDPHVFLHGPARCPRPRGGSHRAGPEGSGAAAAREPLTAPAPHARSPPPFPTAAAALRRARYGGCRGTAPAAARGGAVLR